ncbi:Four helix bundle sensory module for signal transduction [Pedobacter sp. ok626]|uniref:MCP four helix bundle domain-containing protein n=1 Tax=Pedobacter sp. ok626 TaxID=1761882 RepID=UPI000884C135|nr:MCP four helix bundle domain-containing protein [Pedobacter sp. ok626]SDJ98599.1 Four helix bundle sensory module for signal transduction [Pedobacter sp. ok626]
MRFAYSIKQKMKIAVLLFCIMACTLLIRFLEDKSVKSMNESFVSMYNDRLIPATDLFYVAENAYLKKSLFEDALYGADQAFDAESLKSKLAKLNVSIDSLINKYGKTFLVKLEKEQLEELKKGLESTVGVENRILAIATTQGVEEARKLYNNEGRDSSNKTIKKLSELMSIQKQIGEELIKDSAFMVSGNKLYSSFQVVLAIVIGILIVGIVFTSNVVKINNEKFNLN